LDEIGSDLYFMKIVLMACRKVGLDGEREAGNQRISQETVAKA
jgi:hypothetical protein